MKRSLGDKRRYLDDKTINQLTREHGAFKKSETCKIFGNEDFGYRRITVERPLRLRFQITDAAKEQFLNTCPDLYDAVEAIEQALGGEPYLDWNDAWKRVQQIVKECENGWSEGAKGTRQKKIFRECFTETDPQAEPVIAKHVNLSGVVSDEHFPGHEVVSKHKPKALDEIFGVFPEAKGKAFQYEADAKLRDNENVPLKEDVVSFFLREVRPYVADAWINPDIKLRDEKDGGIGKVGYEINFNRVFFKYEPPRELRVIDAELSGVEARIMEMLKEVTT